MLNANQSVLSTLTAHRTWPAETSSVTIHVQEFVDFMQPVQLQTTPHNADVTLATKEMHLLPVIELQQLLSLQRLLILAIQLLVDPMQSALKETGLLHAVAFLSTLEIHILHVDPSVPSTQSVPLIELVATYTASIPVLDFVE